jgi:hypothetical protein
MTNDTFEGEGRTAKALMFAMLAGAALLFFEVTWAPTVQTAPAHAPVAQTVVHHDRLASN